MAQTENFDQGRPSNPAIHIVRRLIGIVTVLVLIAVLLAQATQNWRRIIQLAGERISNWSTLEDAAKTPGTGLFLLTDEVLASIYFLQKSNAETFRLSQELGADAYLSQRISEVAWPKTIDATSPHVLRLDTEGVICTPVFSEKGVALDRCE